MQQVSVYLRICVVVAGLGTFGVRLPAAVSCALVIAQPVEAGHSRHDSSRAPRAPPPARASLSHASRPRYGDRAHIIVRATCRTCTHPHIVSSVRDT